jgi:hypothetical protein
MNTIQPPVPVVEFKADTIAAANRNKENRRLANQRYASKMRDAAHEIIFPEIVDPERRANAGDSLETFLRTYFGHEFHKPFSPDQLDGLSCAAQVINEGGRFVIAAPRGDGKTTRLARAALFSILYGKREFVLIVGADARKANALLQILAQDIKSNPLLLEDFPEYVYPFTVTKSRQALVKLRHNGKPLNLDMVKDKIQFGNGAIIYACGLTGSLRGMIFSNAEGQTIRPDLVLVDDPQTDESAKSPMQTAEREALICGTIAGLVSPLKAIAMLCLVTVIRRGDLADRLLDNIKLHPEFVARKYQLLYSWGNENDLARWGEYDTLWRDSKTDAAAYYAANLQGKTAASVGWEHRIRAGEIDALHTARNLYLENPQNFDSEYNNSPRLSTTNAGFELSEEEICAKQSGYKRGIVPENSTFLIAMDVNLYALSWVGLAVGASGASSVVDYGLSTGEGGTIWNKKSGLSEEAAIYNAIVSTVQTIRAKPYKTESGNPTTPQAYGVDCGYRSETVIAACAFLRRSGVNVYPVRGFSSAYYSPRKYFRRGDSWHTGTYLSSTVLFLNSDIWKERTQKGFLVYNNAVGWSLSLFAAEPKDHSVFAAQILGERIADILTGEKGGIVYKWFLLPSSKNDLLDATAYALALASFLGVSVKAGHFAPEASNPAPNPAPSTAPRSRPNPAPGLAPNPAPGLAPNPAPGPEPTPPQPQFEPRKVEKITPPPPRKDQKARDTRRHGAIRGGYATRW